MCTIYIYKNKINHTHVAGLALTMTGPHRRWRPQPPFQCQLVGATWAPSTGYENYHDEADYDISFTYLGTINGCTQS